MTDREREYAPRGPLHLRSPVTQVILVLAVLASHGWMTSLEFQLDDFEQVRDAADPGEPAVLLGQDGPEQREQRGHRSMVAFFRPVLHASFAADVFLFGANPFALHAMSLFWHALVVLVFRRLMRRLLLRSRLETRLDRIELWSFLSALLVAVHPGTWGAVSWVAARGDVLAALFFLVALDLLAAHREDPKRGRPILVVVALLLGLFSKEGALVAPVLVAAIDLVFLRRRPEEHLKPRRTWPFDLLLIAMAPAYLVLRRLVFGDQADFYAGYERLVTWEIIGRVLGDIAPTLSMLVGGSFHGAGGVPGDWLRSALTTMLLLVPIPWLLRRPLRRSCFVVFASALYLIAAAAPLRFFEEASGFDASRLFYLPFLFVAPLLALPFLALSSKVRSFRRLGLAFTVVAFLAWGLGAWAQISSQLGAASVVRTVRENLLAIASEPGGDEVVYVTVGIPTDVDHVPTYGTFLRIAFKEPFVDRSLEVFPVQEGRLAAELRNRRLFDRNTPRPVRILEWRHDSSATEAARLVSTTGVLPPPGGPRPRLEFPQGSDTLAFPAPIRPRDVPVLALEFDPTAVWGKSVANLVFETEDGRSVAVTLDLELAETDMPGRYLVELAERSDWLFSPPFTRLRWVPVSGRLTRPSAVDFAAELPPIELMVEKTVSIAAGDPGLRFREPPGERYGWFRIRVFLDSTTRSFTYPRERLEELEDGSLLVRLDSPGFNPGEDPLPLADLVRDGRNVLDEKGVLALPLGYRIEALRGSMRPAASPQAASPIGRLLLTR